ncbi:uncharacterized protein LOC123508768 isoform X1 [Portunus trituberculatus]|uniref:uncharacterized protein LOC123508768 isoform X1 n=1 Tax=Portunus trituberculatus TaxID=210409 RepID=UPI001E1CB7C5|nr:uncharacterized protein LOC123508768 isoform X1 [Portunus trituberculatus]
MPNIPSEVTSFVGDLASSVDLFKNQVKDAVKSLDLTTVAALLLVVAGAILLYDLLVFALASAASRRSFMVTPLLYRLAHNAWDMRDEMGFTNLIESRLGSGALGMVSDPLASFRSLQEAFPILDSIEKAYEKYQDLLDFN